jgi:hypothetical protein
MFTPEKRRVGPEPGTRTSNHPTTSASRPPGNKDVRFVKRQLTSLVDDGIAVREEVEETELVLGRVMLVANEISGDVREISWIRHKVESHVLRELKYDRTLWDGTCVMADPKARKKWEGFLKNLRAEELANYQQTIRELDEVLEQQYAHFHLHYLISVQLTTVTATVPTECRLTLPISRTVDLSRRRRVLEGESENLTSRVVGI